MATVIHLPIARPAEPAIASAGGSITGALDVAINGLGFVLAVSQQDPIVRETAQYKKDQFDNSQEPGEQTLTNWWLRSQASFHGGAGRRYLELPGDDDRLRFDTSFNLDVWTPGKAIPLPDTAQVISSGSTCGGLVGAHQGTNSYALVAFGSSLSGRKITDAGVESTISYTWGGADTIQSLATDGKTYYAASATAIYSGPVDNSGSGSALWNSGTLVKVAWVKQRLMAGVNEKVYELVGGAPPTLPTAIYSHPNTDWRWTAFAESPRGILAAGYSGDESAIIEFTLDTDGGAPTLAAGTVVATFPLGERVYALHAYAGRFVGIGTGAGFRVGVFADSGALSYGALTFTTTAPVRAITAQGNAFFPAVTAGVEGESALVHVDLGTPSDDAGRFAWANDVVCPAAQTGAATGATVVAGRRAFVVEGYGLVLAGSTPGSNRPAWIRSSRIRYSTVEPKLFKFATIRGYFPGTLNVYAQTPSIDETLILSLDGPGVDPPEFAPPAGSHEWLTLKIELADHDDNELRTWQVKALPGTKRQRMIQLPLVCFDRFKDRHGRVQGGPGYALSLIRALEVLEEAGDVVQFENLMPHNTETRRCQIDRITFQQTVQPTATSGYGGVLTVTLRTVD